MFLNVIIPSYRAKATIAETIRSVLANRTTFSGEFDITVVDSSDDDTADAVESLPQKVRIIRLPERAYPGAARNRGVANTNGDIICFIDADARAADNWLSAIRGYFESHPDVAAVGGPVLNANPDEGYSRLAHWCEFSGYGPNAPEGVRRVQPTVNVAIRRDVFEHYGPFLEDQFGNEDVLLFHRMKLAGEQLHFTRTIRVYHRNKTRLEDIYRHQHNLGRCTGRARVMFDLPGSFLTRPGWPWLVPLVKTHFIGWRLLTQETREWPAFLASWPRVLAAMQHFARGFNEGAREGQKEER